MLGSVVVLCSGVVEKSMKDRDRVITRCRIADSLPPPLPLALPTGCGPEEGQKGFEKAVVVSVSVVAITPAIALAFTFSSFPVPVPAAIAVTIAVGGPVVAGLWWESEFVSLEYLITS